MSVSIRDHGFLQNAEFCAEPWNLPVSAEFLDFCRIRYWPVIRGLIQHYSSGSGGGRKLFTACRHDCAVKYVTANQALMGGILKILILFQILPVYFVNRLYLSVAVASAYLVRFRQLQ